jgi:hypothetical protein
MDACRLTSTELLQSDFQSMERIGSLSASNRSCDDGRERYRDCTTHETWSIQCDAVTLGYQLGLLATWSIFAPSQTTKVSPKATTHLTRALNVVWFRHKWGVSLPRVT